MTSTASHQTDETVVALNADVVGYSRLLAEDFDTVTETMEKYQRLVEDEVTRHSGSLINFVGDNFMAKFDSAASGIGAAIGIASEIESRNSEVPASKRIRFRMGLDEGQVRHTEDQYFGEALNVAARIQAIAVPGGVSVSGRVYRSLDEPRLRFRPIGHQNLKNIPEDTEVFELTDLPAGEGLHRVARPLALEPPTVAVLPIHNAEVTESLRSASELIRRDLIHRLSGVPGLSVIEARVDDEGTNSRIARYMLETGVHEFGDDVRLFATLFDITTWNVVKSHKWSGTVSQILEMSEDVANDVARSVEVELIVGAPAGLYAELEDAGTIEKVYLGWFHLRTDTEEGWAKAVDLFGEVASSKPDLPYGYLLSAFANWIAASNDWGSDPDATLELAKDQAEVALGLSDPTGMAQAVQAAVLMSQGREDEALAAMEGLEIIRPTCDVTYGLEGSVRRYMGQWEKSVDLMDVAMRLTGLNKPWYPTVQACSLFMGGRIDKSAALAEMVLEHQPNNLEALLVLAASQVELGMDRSAKATGEKINERFPSVDIAEWLEKRPYHDRTLVDRWKNDLASAGAIDIS